MGWEKKRVLVTVKAYPEPSKKHKESVCTAGIAEDGEFIRLYPIPMEIFRNPALKFSKYDYIEAECRKASGEEKLGRKESYKVRYKTIRVVDKSLSTTPINWEERNKIILPLQTDSVESLPELFERDRTSLALIKPKEILDFYKTRELTEEEKEISKHVQTTITGKEHTPLQKIPHVFKYKFMCYGNECKTHDITCEDWELFEAYRRWDYPTERILWKKIQQRFLDFMSKRDLYFYMGTHSLYPSWLIIGLYYPPKTV